MSRAAVETIEIHASLTRIEHLPAHRIAAVVCLTVIRPGDHEAPTRQRRDSRGTRRNGDDGELDSDPATIGVEHLPAHGTSAVAALIRPDYYEVPVRERPDRWLELRVLRSGVDEELEVPLALNTLPRTAWR